MKNSCDFWFPFFLANIAVCEFPSCIFHSEAIVVLSVISWHIMHCHSSHASKYLLLFLLRSAFVRADQNVTCYFPDGDQIHDPADYYTACPTSANNDGYHMCCKTDANFDDVCNPNGLCSRPHNPGLGEEQGLLRSTCTDPSWTSDSCLKLCITGIGKYMTLHRNILL